jgi:hypothetical protein
MRVFTIGIASLLCATLAHSEVRCEIHVDVINVGCDRESNKPDLVPRLPIAVETAWADAGAVVAWMSSVPHGLRFHLRAEGERAEMPALRFVVWKAGVISRLPTPELSFGLDFMDTEINDEALKELAPLNRLRCLNLAGTKITGAGLRHLTQSPESLDLSKRRDRCGPEADKRTRKTRISVPWNDGDN